MAKEEFIDLVQVSPIVLDSKRAQDIAEKTVQDGMDFGELFVALYQIYSLVNDIKQKSKQIKI